MRRVRKRTKEESKDENLRSGVFAEEKARISNFDKIRFAVKNQLNRY